MNKYLARLRPGSGADSSPPPPSVSFVSATGGHTEKSADRDGLVCDGALYADGPYLPWGPYVNREQLDAMQRELFSVVDELAKLEGWPDEGYDHVVMCIERQPISTLRPDLAHFAERLRIARVEAAARDAAARRSWRFDR
ncbi:hypothetical protein [Paraburkholderia nodosa]|uniref:hypothetical protein n=1 Tax=Paraburkholderia nodosa TaxID=392320 RepID=UPI000841F4DC|nr:hypothetical protein [Paraburkholderia nodosa]